VIAKVLIAALLVGAIVLLLRRPARIVMDEGEAREVLGVAADTDADTIRAAHRRLIAAVHPDRGGSPDLARRINAARDALLRR